MTPPKLDHEVAAMSLAPYAAGTLPATESVAVAAHLAECGSCRLDLERWLAVAKATRVALPPEVPPSRVLRTVGRQLPPRSTWSLQRLGALLKAQAPLVRQQLWTASALVIGLGLLVLVLGRGGAGVLDLLAPVAAAVGIGFLYGPDQDPALELALCTPTSPRLILLARLTLVFGYDLLLGILASLGLAALGQAPAGVWQLVLQWLGPMLLLSAVSLWLSQRLGALSATFVPLTIWGVKVALSGALDPTGPALPLLTLVGTTNTLSLVLAVALVASVLVALPAQERLRCA